MDLAISSVTRFTWADATTCFSCILITSAGDYKSDAVVGAAASRLAGCFPAAGGRGACRCRSTGNKRACY